MEERARERLARKELMDQKRRRAEEEKLVKSATAHHSLRPLVWLSADRLSFPPQARLKLEQERKEAELLAEKQELLKKKREEKRLQREVSAFVGLGKFWSPPFEHKRVVDHLGTRNTPSCAINDEAIRSRLLIARYQTKSIERSRGRSESNLPRWPKAVLSALSLFHQCDYLGNQTVRREGGDGLRACVCLWGGVGWVYQTLSCRMISRPLIRPFLHQRELEKQQRLEQVREMNSRADQHYARTLLQTRGVLPWRRLVAMTQENMGVAVKHHNIGLLEGCFYPWLEHTRRANQEREIAAGQLANKILLKRSWRQWRKVRSCALALLCFEPWIDKL